LSHGTDVTDDTDVTDVTDVNGKNIPFQNTDVEKTARNMCIFSGFAPNAISL